MGMWRCWVCQRCKIVSYHHIVWCPRCPNRMEFFKDFSSELKKRFPSNKPTDEYTPYEWMGKEFENKQPWCYNKDENRPEGPSAVPDQSGKIIEWLHDLKKK